MIKFSLVVPFFLTKKDDRTSYMNELLCSLPDRADLEVLLVDDHSEFDYEQENPFEQTKLIRIDNNIGKKFAGSARNAGICKSRGDYLIFADSDDMFCCQNFSAALDSVYDNQDEDIVVCRATSFIEDGKIGTRHLYADNLISKFNQTGDPHDLIPFHGPWAKIIRKSFVMKHMVEFGETRLANDVLFNVKLMLASPRIRVFEDTIYRIRQGNSSLTNDPSWSAIKIRLAVARQVHELLILAGRPDLRSPLHYQYQKYFKAFPIKTFAEFVRSLTAGDLVFSPPKKMFSTLSKKVGLY